jgi:cytochrome c-type biogenesis protein CcmH/NrfG
VRSANLLKIAADAELLRQRAFVKRQARRGAFGAIAAVFAVAALALGELTGWQAVRLEVQPIPARLVGISKRTPLGEQRHG